MTVVENRSDLPELPATLQRHADAQLASLPFNISLLDSATGQNLRRVIALSDFAALELSREQDWILAALQQHAFDQKPQIDWLARELAEGLPVCQSMTPLQKLLRRLRNRFQFWIVWRHLLGLAPLEETVASLSEIADRLIDAALTAVSAWEIASYGQPQLSATGVPQRLVVIALGKLGARELNLSSDVDLLFAFPEDGQTSKGRTHQQLFQRIGQRLIEALDPMTEHGFVYRVDMRLRPFGTSGPLVASFAAVESYYEANGRDWERYALIKARQVAGDESGAELLRALRPFVFRRYLDFGALDALREMKAKLLAERKDLDDVKLGPGGIRDTEFSVQVQQLIWAGREPDLQCAPLLDAADALVKLGLWDADPTTRLLQAYRFLRDTEHSLQAEADRQTQRLPRRERGQIRLALAMGFSNYAEFISELDTHRTVVRDMFADVVAVTGQDDIPPDSILIWDQLDETALQNLGFIDAPGIAQQLDRVVAARDRSYVAAQSRVRMDRFMPVLLRAVLTTAQPDLALGRVLPIVHSVLRRSAYLVLLEKNPQALDRLLGLCIDSRRLAEELARHPAFLDAMLDDRQWVRIPDATALVAELDTRLAAAEGQDEERILDVLRNFKEHHQFHAALAEIQGTLSLMKASDYYTWLAEALLQASLQVAWDLTPISDTQLHDFGVESATGAPLLLVGFGKLGGLELGPGSDLDLICLHGLPLEAGPILHRLVRKLLHILTVPTYLGPLYEVDMRLRPSGKAGTLVSSMSALRDYEVNEAWLWEHQALVRARPVAGDPNLAEIFQEIRRDVLCIARDPAQVAAEVSTMRGRMLAQKGDGQSLKQAAGGIVDIEFMVQYLVLAHAHKHPELVRFTDNVRILETVEALALLPGAAAQQLREAYIDLRSEWHRGLLDLPDETREVAVLDRHRSAVRKLWAQLIDGA